MNTLKKAFKRHVCKEENRITGYIQPKEKKPENMFDLTENHQSIYSLLVKAIVELKKFYNQCIQIRNKEGSHKPHKTT